ncbi:MAG: arylsulfatase [Spirochaetaceae bacterium]|nr:MAG: arylsulfatase [Spirochaetaceae bacterium]
MNKPNAAGAAQPNVIVFFTDQQRWDTSSLHGNPLDLMPNFERMAFRGTHLPHHFTCQPVCGPARACFQTGRYATETGCYRNGIPLRDGAHTLATEFNTAGYHTGYIGKWHLGGTTPNWDRDQQEPVPPQRRGGYREWLAADMLEFASDAYDTRLFDTDDCLVRLPGYRVDALTDAAIRFVDRHQREPFFLFLSFLEPHHQNSRDDYPAPRGYEERYRGGWIPPDLQHLVGSAAKHVAGYYGMIKRLDEALGRLLETLASLGLEDDTVLLFTSDHGNHFKTRNGEYKRSCHDASIRVPTAIQGPGFDGGGRVEALTSIVDLMPTLLDAAGIPLPASVSGRSILPLLKHGTDPAGIGMASREGRTDSAWPDDVYVQISESQVGRAVRTRRWKYSVVALDVDPVSESRADRYTEECLYDLVSDPYELENLIDEPAYRRVAERMRVRLLKRIMSIEGEVPEIIPVPPGAASGQRVVLPEEIDA